jgi:2-dehydropantoate 2-reductase
MRPDVAVIGAGGVGTLLAARLLGGGHRVILCTRRPVHEVVVDGPEGRDAFAIDAVQDPAAVAPSPWVLLATKAHQTASAAAWLRALCGPESVLAVLQNGVDHEARVAPFVHDVAVLPVLTYTHVVPVASGHTRHVEGERLVVPAGETGERFRALLGPAGLRVELEPDFHTARWRKLLGNVAANPVTALTGRRGEVLRDPEVLELLEGLMQECAMVARADGAGLTDADVETLLDHFRQYPPDGGTSMLWDRLAGRPLEHEELTGAVVAAGRRLGVPTPRHAVLLPLLRAISP